MVHVMTVKLLLFVRGKYTVMEEVYHNIVLLDPARYRAPGRRASSEI
jgi:hypothetical protein